MLRRLDDVERRRNTASVSLSMKKSLDRIKIDLILLEILLKKASISALETV